MTNEKLVPQDTVQQIFNTYIAGNVQNVATGSTNVRQHAKWQETSNAELFSRLLDAVVSANIPKPLQAEVTGVIEELRDTSGTTGFKEKYNRFMGILADHMQVLGPVVAPYLTPLTAMLA